MSTRKLSGIFFRAKIDGKYEAVCFEDMTTDQQNEVMKGRSEEWLMSLARSLATTLREVGDEFDIAKEDA